YNVHTALYNPPFYPWPVIRLAELYLGYAEACVECNDLTNAKKYLNEVRERAGIPDVETSWNGIATLDQNKMREIVRQERTIEFYLENHTFWDLRRWKDAERYFGVKVKGMNIFGKNIDDFAQETEVSFERKFESPTQYLMPIPVTDVNRNLNLIQNPGY
ncbi:MAG: RagB/SusD family nutrient uptake outer membrane protein, partial [Odoribacter sp.]|nr:RagB/SusD family nutrient uptake outer membrane protein [Odoribacter sp.]